VNSALEQIWKRADLRGHVISYDETRGWPAAELVLKRIRQPDRKFEKITLKADLHIRP
jgi:hypothetical protein